MRTIDMEEIEEYRRFAEEALEWFRKKDRLYVSYSRSGTFKRGELIAIRNDTDYSNQLKKYQGLGIIIIKVDEDCEPVEFPDREVRGWK